MRLWWHPPGEHEVWDRGRAHNPQPGKGCPTELAGIESAREVRGKGENTIGSGLMPPSAFGPGAERRGDGDREARKAGRGQWVEKVIIRHPTHVC